MRPTAALQRTPPTPLVQGESATPRCRRPYPGPAEAGPIADRVGAIELNGPIFQPDASKNRWRCGLRRDSFSPVMRRRMMAAGQPGFFDADERLEALSAAGDPLERLAGVVDFEVFRSELERALGRSDRLKGGR